MHSDNHGHLEPLAVTKSRAYELTSYPKLVQRWLYWTRRATSSADAWVVIVREGKRGCETLIDFASLKTAYHRFCRGDEPPPMPSE